MWKYVKRLNAQRSNYSASYPVGDSLKLALILAIYLVLAVFYSIVVPIGRGADEWAHYWYAQFIAQHGRLPANPAEREAAGYKSDWPPLYHLSAAALTGWVQIDGPPTLKYRIDPLTGVTNIRRQLVPAQGPDAILHTDDELFPWQQEILVWHLGRFLSIAFSAAALLVTYLIALEVFQSSGVAGSRGVEEQGSRGAERHATRNTQHARRFTFYASHLAPQTLALVSVAFLAFIPRFLFTGMVFGYDSLTLLLASLFLWLVLRIARGYHHRWGFWVLGALAGLALLTKYLAALLPLEIALLILSRTAAGEQGSKGAGEQGGRGAGELSETHRAPRTMQDARRKTQDASRFTFYVLPLLQFALAYLLVTSGWFGYLLLNFNEVDRYGPILGTVAPLLRGDGSDRTVEQLFAWLSGGQAPPPAHIDQPTYTMWQLISGFFTTLWGNPVIQPYPLNWFVVVMSGIALIALMSLLISRRVFPSPGALASSSNVPTFQRSNPLLASSPPRLLAPLLLLHCLLPLPFMIIRLFGARDALEAVQGRHLLFLSGPAFVILLVWGILNLTFHVLPFNKLRAGCFTFHASRLTPHIPHLTLYALIGLLLVGAVSQLSYMDNSYPALLPVRTMPYQSEPTAQLSTVITLPGGSRLIDYQIEENTSSSLTRFASPLPSALKVSMIWQAGAQPAPEDYRLELALVDDQGQTHSSWLAYQTQAHYPTRAWEAGDVIRDEGWLPLVGLPAGTYEARWRLLGESEHILDWQTLTTYTLIERSETPSQSEWLLWRDGLIPLQPPLLRERETIQITLPDANPPTLQPSNPPLVATLQPSNLQPPTSNLQLTGPDGLPRSPASAGPTWANFIIGPDWPAGDYRLPPDGKVVLRVAKNERNYQMPALTHPLEANFEGQVKLLGYDLPVRRVQPGEGTPITLYWQGQRWMGEDFVIFDRLLDNQGIAWGGYDRLTRENYSTLLWAPGEIVVDGFAVPVAADAPDGIYTLSLGWYRQVNGAAKSLSILDPATGQPTETSAVTIGPVKVGGPPPGVTIPTAEPENEVNITLGEQIKLLGFDIAKGELATKYGVTEDRQSDATSPPPRLSASSPLHLTLYWQALTAPANDYTVFVHVRNNAGETVAQKDSPPVGGAYPTGLWDSGEIIKDEVSISLDTLKPGPYDLVVGMYDFASGARLPVAGLPDNAIILSSFEIVAK